MSDDASHLRGQSVFTPSPFVLELKHKDMPLRTVMEVIRVLPRLSNDDKQMQVLLFLQLS